MSLTFKANVSRKQLVEFLATEYAKGTGIPVHVYSVVNATFSCYNKMLAITDNKEGTIFLEENKLFKSYGGGNPFGLVNTLKRCGANLKCVD